jgi:hypothetical protein
MRLVASQGQPIECFVIAASIPHTAFAKTLEVYRHGGDVWHRLAVHHGDVGVRAEPYDAIELALGLVWER